MITAAGDSGPITRDGAREAARRELSKGIYHRNDEPWPLRVLHAVQHWLDHVLHAVSRHAPGGGAGAVALLLAALALIGFVWWRVGFIRRTPTASHTVLETRRRTSGDLLREAETALFEERWDDAVIARMRALAMVVEERGLVDPRPGRTADELAAEVATAMPGADQPLRAAAVTFDAVIYGRRRATRDSYDVVAGAAEPIERELRSRRPLAVAGR